MDMALHHLEQNIRGKSMVKAEDQVVQNGSKESANDIATVRTGGDI